MAWEVSQPPLENMISGLSFTINPQLNHTAADKFPFTLITCLIGHRILFNLFFLTVAKVTFQASTVLRSYPSTPFRSYLNSTRYFSSRITELMGVLLANDPQAKWWPWVRLPLFVYIHDSHVHPWPDSSLSRGTRQECINRFKSITITQFFPVHRCPLFPSS